MNFLAVTFRKATIPVFTSCFLLGAYVEISRAAAATESPEKSLKTYAMDLAKKNSTDFSVSGSPIKSLDSPLTYRTVFLAKNVSSLPTTQTSNGSLKEVDANLARTKKWQATYCTDELRAIMLQHKIYVASANLIDAKGKSRSTAMCISQTAKSSPPKTDFGLAGDGAFNSVQICRAALSLSFGRDLSIMRGKMLDGFAQVKYVRTSDSREFSYRCKLINGLVLTWDDSISGARWYGENPSDFQIKYSVSGNLLLIQELIKGKVNKEKNYSFADLDV